MSIKKVSISFSEADVNALSSLTGQTWRLITGDVLDEYPNHLSCWGEAVVVTTTGNLRLSISPFDFELEPGDDDDLGILEATQSENLPKEKIKKGEVSLKFGGQEIRQVFLIRESIRRSGLDGTGWEMTNDYGVVFLLETGAVAVYKAGYQGFFLDIAMAENLETLEIPSGSGFWTSEVEIGETYEIKRAFIPIRE